MRYAKDANGKHTPWVRKYQISASISTAGTPVVLGASATAGVANGTTTSTTNFLGVAWSTNTYVTAQQAASSYMASQKPATGADNERLVQVCINPFAVWEMILNGGATDGTNLTKYATTSASSDGSAVTTSGTSWSSPTYLNGVVWGYDGANAGRSRRITTVGAGSCNTVVTFQSAIASGDNFLRAPYWPGHSTTVQLTSNLVNADATIAVGTGANFTCIDLALYDINTTKGLNQSKVYALNTDHILR